MSDIIHMTEEYKNGTSAATSDRDTPKPKTPKGKPRRKTAKEIFSAINITRMAVFTALSTVLYLFVKFPLPIFPSWLDVQISELPALLAGYMMGPWYGAVVIVLKCLIKMPMSSTACVGELGDILIGLAYVLPACFFYKYHRNIKGALISLVIGISASSAVGVLVNRVILIPMYLELYFNGDWSILTGMLKPLFSDVTVDSFYYYYLLGGVLPFNLFRGIISGLATFLLYKHLERFFNYVFNKDKKRMNALNNGRYEIKTEKQMEKLGAAVAKELTGGEVILLTGELGAGKTVFCKGLAKGLGVDVPVVSPTFTLMNEYFGKGVKFCHFDAYRLADSDEAQAAGLGDFIGDRGTVCAVEWWENISDMFDGCKTIKVKIDKTEKGREVTVEI